MAAAYGPKGLRVNVVCPGYIATRMGAPLVANPEISKALIDKTPLKRWGQSEDVANLALFLASDESSFLTGTTIPIDGGVVASLAALHE